MTQEVVTQDMSSVLTEVREYAAREASMYEVSGDQYAAQNESARADAEVAVADAYRDIVALFDRLAPGLPVPEAAAPEAPGKYPADRDDPWAVRQ